MQAANTQAAVQAATLQHELARLQRENASLAHVDGAPTVVGLPTLDVKKAGLMMACSDAYALMTQWKEMGGPLFTVGDVAVACLTFRVALKSVLRPHIMPSLAARPPDDSISSKQLAAPLQGALEALEGRRQNLATKRNAERARGDDPGASDGK